MVKLPPYMLTQSVGIVSIFIILQPLKEQPVKLVNYFSYRQLLWLSDVLHVDMFTYYMLLLSKYCWFNRKRKFRHLANCIKWLFKTKFLGKIFCRLWENQTEQSLQSITFLLWRKSCFDGGGLLLLWWLILTAAPKGFPQTAESEWGAT